MYQIDLINRLLKSYKRWTLQLNVATINIKNNILQTDEGDKVQQKIVSIIISAVLIFIISSIFEAAGVVITTVLSIIFFAVGLFLSKYINNKIYGSRREYSDLNEEEKILINKLQKTYETHIKIRDNINNNKYPVNFVNYVALKNEFDAIYRVLELFDVTNLAYIYRARQHMSKRKYKILINKFDEIYAHKIKG